MTQPNSIPTFTSAPAVDLQNEIQTVADFDAPLWHLYQTGMKGGESTGFPSLDPHFTVRAREWTLVTGIPSHGKSAFLDALMVNMAIEKQWKWAVFSAENRPLERHAASLMAQYAGRPFGPGLRTRISESEYQWARMFIQRHFRFLVPPDNDCTIDRIIGQCERLASGQPHAWASDIDGGIQGVVIDPWNELDHSRPASLTETEYISRTLTRIRRFARSYDVHVFIVAHPGKLARIKTVARNGGEAETYPVPTPYDVSGSAHWRNKADNCLCVWRDVEQPGTCEVHVQKVRFREVGSVGRVSMGFDMATGQYLDPLVNVRFPRSESGMRELATRLEEQR